eukprot:Skav226900  [mRNA]  locus=scaffold2258:237112:238620:- [translate_table: standard]
MVALRSAPEILEALSEWGDAEGNPIALTETAEIGLETNRGRELGPCQVLLVDLPWSACAQLRGPLRLRGDAANRVVRMSVGDQVGRPRTADLWGASEAWLIEKEGDDILAEYFSAESEHALPEVDQPQELGQDEAGDQADVIRQLQARIVELESGQTAAATRMNGAAGVAQDIFPMANAGQLTEASWQQLQALAGPAPRRATRAEANPAVKPQVFDVQAEVSAGVLEEEVLAQLSQSGDAMQKLMVLQLQQTSQLIQKLVPKHHNDPLSHALASSSDSGGSVSGVKGCHARDIFVRQMDDLQMISSTTTKNVLQDLGLRQPRTSLAYEQHFGATTGGCQ